MKQRKSYDGFANGLLESLPGWSELFRGQRNAIGDESDLRWCEGGEMTILVYSFQHDI